jgi:tRNA dimethylallyltransferase
MKNKLIVILGPTSSGKTDLSIKLAKKFKGEVVSADSRQVYKGMNIGSGKITKKEMQGIPHYLLDIADPKRKFTVSQYQKLAIKAIEQIQKNSKIPFLVGGSPFYINSIVNGIVIPEVKPDWSLRKKLEKKSNNEMFLMLKKLDPIRSGSIDEHNPRRLVRALEIVLKTGKPIPKINTGTSGGLAETDILQIGITKNINQLQKLIQIRLQKRLKNNAMINEVKKLKKSGVSFKRLQEFGLEYRFVAQYLQNKITKQEMMDKIQKESEHFVKKQMTWFKKDNRIHWIKNQKQAENLIKKFLY